MIGNKLKEIRKNRNLTQAEISQLIGVSQNTYSGYETDKHEPDLNTLIKIADTLKISLDYLTGRF